MFISVARLHFGGQDSALNSTNSRSALMQPDIVTTKLHNELSRGRIAGPYQSAQLPDFKSSPLAPREKQESGKFRLFHNLSYPYDLQSVNHNIPKFAAHVKYETITDVITAIQQQSRNAYLAKSDIADAFRLIPLHSSQYHRTGFSWQNEYYYDRCLPQGSASSCKTFELFSTALKMILQQKLGIQSVLDDFLFVANTQHECMTALNCFTRICNEVQEQWPVDWQKQDITVLELYPIYILVHMFKHKLRHTNY